MRGDEDYHSLVQEGKGFSLLYLGFVRGIHFRTQGNLIKFIDWSFHFRTHGNMINIIYLLLFIPLNWKNIVSYPLDEIDMWYYFGCEII